jgi:ribosomal protein S18 acetylase RimI-like enzyme
MTIAVIIRSAAAEDFDPLCDLYCRSIKCNPNGFVQDLAFHGCLIQRTKEWREAGGDMLVACVNGKLAGLGGLAPQDGLRAELCKLHVDPECQGRGIGRLLATELISLAAKAGFPEVVLHVTATQTAAITLYRCLGFRETGREEFKAGVFGVPVSFDTIYMSLAVTSELALGNNSSFSASSAF